MKVLIILTLFFLFISPYKVKSLGVLSHEAVVDAAWDKSIVPLLMAKYPSASKEDINTAHAYAYGGAIAPDIGYYPLSSLLFSNLVHYVRSGDLVDAMIRDARNLNEYAFALGFLSHYYADNYGHSIATNRSVPLTYPTLVRKYGTTITYADDPTSHTRMEFGFDVLQVANGNYGSNADIDFVGFKVDTSVLSRAFYDTYGLDINKVFNNRFNTAIEIFRFTIANVIPVLAKVAWSSKKSEIKKRNQSETKRSFHYRFRLREFNQKYGTGYKRPGFFPVLLSFAIRVLPKVGPLKRFKFKVPTPLSERYLHQGMDTILLYYTTNLKAAKVNTLHRDKDFDTGNPTTPCEYSLTDETYGEWVLQLKRENYKTVTPGIRENITGFYNSYPSRSSSKTCVELFNAVKDIKGVEQ